MLYRLFGDKNRLLSAVVDYGFDRYLAAKRAAEGSPDPVEDLRNGWDTHVGFALAHPAVYRLMYSPSFRALPAAAQEALRLLREVLLRCATAGKLRSTPEVAAQAIMSANIGVALNLVTQPEIYDDPGLSHRVRDAVFGRLLVEDDGSRAAERGAERGVAPAASQLAALLRAGQECPLSEPETALLLHWLDRLAGQDA